MKKFLLAAIVAAASINHAIASPLSDAARARFSAIAAGHISVLMSDYAEHPQLNWIGGPLDGTYAGTDMIRITWERFSKAAGPLKVSVSNLEESANPKGATVIANVQFDGKTSIKVRYVLTYRDNKLVNETWQIDPKLSVTPT